MTSGVWLDHPRLRGLLIRTVFTYRTGKLHLTIAIVYVWSNRAKSYLATAVAQQEAQRDSRQSRYSDVCPDLSLDCLVVRDHLVLLLTQLCKVRLSFAETAKMLCLN